MPDARAAILEMQITGRDERAKAKRVPTVSEYLAYWQQSLGTSRAVEPSTLERYEQTIRLHVAPYVGRLRVNAFTVETALSYYASLERDGYSPSTRRKAHAVLSAALADAVPRWLHDNPLARVPRRAKPKYRPEQRRPYSLEEVRTFVAAVAGTPLEALYMLAIFGQLREGEIFALERHSVAADCSYVLVEASAKRGSETGGPKTEAGRRRVDLPRIAAASLARHLSPASLLKRRASANALVFPGPRGARLRGNNFLRRELYPTMASAKLRQITFHDLRHSGAMLIADRVPMTVLRERLGHESDSTTLLYAGHRTPGLGALAVQAFDGLFPIAPHTSTIES